MLIDTHCHLDAAEFDPDRASCLAEAMRQGVTRIVIPAVAVDQFPAVRTLTQHEPACRPAYGIHPLYVGGELEDAMASLEHWLRTEPAVAVGEIGLDHFVADADPEQQRIWFRAQLKLARRFDLPVILHVRRAVDAVLHALREIPVLGGIAHAFNGSGQQAEEFIKRGFVLGFGGAMTHEGSTRIRSLARELPLEAIVLETDAPDIPPAWLNRGRNSPAELPRIAAVLADLRARPIEAIAEATSANARRVLPGVV